MRLRYAAGTTMALLLVHLGGWPAPAMAQYIWVDDKGIKQWSDRPPPPSVPAARILKTPRAAPAAGASPGTGSDSDAAPAPAAVLPAGAPAAATAPPGPSTTAEREADFQRRRSAAIAADNQAAAAARARADQAANCEAARQNQRALDGGASIVNYGQSGERSIMNDQQRADLAKNTQKVLASCK